MEAEIRWGGTNACASCGNITAAPVCGRCGRQLDGDPDCEGTGDMLLRGWLTMKIKGGRDESRRD